MPATRYHYGGGGKPPDICELLWKIGRGGRSHFKTIQAHKNSQALYESH